MVTTVATSRAHSIPPGDTASDDQPLPADHQIGVDLVDRPARLAKLTTQQRDRLDVSNVSVDQGLALAGACGFVHLDTGRVCQLARRHLESCEFGLRDTRVSGFVASRH